MRSTFRIFAVISVGIIIAAMGGTAWAEPPMGPVYITASQPGDQYEPAVAWDNEHQRWLVVWEQDVSGVRAIVGRLVNQNGYPYDSAFFISDNLAKDATAPDVVYDPGHDRYLVVWEHHYSTTDWDIYGRFVTWDGLEPALPYSIEYENTFQAEPAIEYNPPPVDEYLVVWSDRADFLDTARIKRKRLYPDSGSQVGPSFEIAGDATYERHNPRVAWNAAASRYLVAYERFEGTDQEDVYARSLSYSGSTIGDEFGIAGYAGEENQIDVAACDGSWMVVWKGNQGVAAKIYARPVAGNLSLGSTTDVSETTGDQRWPAVACNPHGVEFFVVWEKKFSTLHDGIAGAFLSSDGSLGDKFNIWDPTIGSDLDFNRPAVSVGDDLNRAFVVWETDRADLAHRDLAGRWVDMALFSDDFETGNTTRWSATVP